jgi:hypothetical protein
MRKLPDSFVTIFEMITVDELRRYPTLHHWLNRELDREHLAGLSAEACKARRLAQIRLCHAKAKRARQVAKLAADKPTHRDGRDWLEVGVHILNV